MSGPCLGRRMAMWFREGSIGLRRSEFLSEHKDALALAHVVDLTSYMRIGSDGSIV